MVDLPPEILRRAIESVGIEKPSDYTLVLEEVERLMDEQKVTLAKPLEWREARVSDKWERYDAETAIGRYEALEWSNGTFGGSIPVDPETSNAEFVSASISEAKDVCQADFEGRLAAMVNTGISALIRAATDLVQEMEEMGYGKTSDRALPGSYDNLLAALKEVKG